MAQEKIYKYPEPDKIQISSSDLKLKFREFLDAVKERLSLFDFLVLAAAWLPMFVSDFRSVGSVSAEAVKGFYAALVVVGTIAWLSRIRRLIKRLFKKGDVEFLHKTEIDPDKKVDCIKSACK